MDESCAKCQLIALGPKTVPNLAFNIPFAYINMTMPRLLLEASENIAVIEFNDGDLDLRLISQHFAGLELIKGFRTFYRSR